MNGWMPNAGDYVRNTHRPEWGPGKVVLVADDCVYVFFRDYEGKSELDGRTARRMKLGHPTLERIESRPDPVLDNLPPFERYGADLRLPHERLSIAMAKKKFLDVFPGGFQGAEYIGSKTTGERAYKIAAHDRWEATLGAGKLEDLLGRGGIREAASLARAVIEATNIVSPYESTALREALAHESAAGAYLRGLADLLAAPIVGRESFEAYLRGFFELPKTGNARVHSWPVCTALPFLAQPQRYMHLKPVETTVAAQRLAFDLKYDATPNWPTYRALLDFAELYMTELSDLGCRDMIDVQSFIWVTCGGYDKQRAKSKLPSSER